MNNQAALVREDNAKLELLYLALELSRKKWKLGFSDGRVGRVRIRTIEARDVQALREEIEAAKRHFRLPSGTLTVSCYEAGREGFWIHRMLTELGIHNVVIAASSLEVKRGKRAKTDRIDVASLTAKLVRYYSGELQVWSVVQVPDEEAEDARHLHREIEVVQREEQQHRMRIQSFLFTQGLDVAVTDGLIRHLDELRCWDGKPLPADMKERIRREYARLQLACQQLRELRKQQQARVKRKKTEAMEKVRKLMNLSGVGVKSSWVFTMELFGWRHFQNRRQVAGAVGLTPMPYQSGDMARDQGISRAGNKRVRSMAVEIAWLWLRYQPDSRLSQWHQEKFGSKSPRLRRIGIVALARRLMVDLWRYVEQDIVPQGARLKSA